MHFQHVALYKLKELYQTDNIVIYITEHNIPLCNYLCCCLLYISGDIWKRFKDIK